MWHPVRAKTIIWYERTILLSILRQYPHQYCFRRVRKTRNQKRYPRSWQSCSLAMDRDVCNWLRSVLCGHFSNAEIGIEHVIETNISEVYILPNASDEHGGWGGRRGAGVRGARRRPEGSPTITAIKKGGPRGTSLPNGNKSNAVSPYCHSGTQRLPKPSQQTTSYFQNSNSLF